MSGEPSSPPRPPSDSRGSPYRLPTLLLWGVPFLLVLTYILLVTQFFHLEARWTGERLFGASASLLITTAVFSTLWFGLAYVCSLLLGQWVPLGVLALIAKIPGIDRHVVITPPARPDHAEEVWGRFGVLVFITLGFELIFMILVVRSGDLAPRLALDAPIRFFVYELLAGLGLAVLIAPAAPFIASRVRTRITDSLEFPYLWLAALLLVVGGASIVEVEILPGLVFNSALFLTSILIYAPGAWYVSLAFSRAEVAAQQGFLARAWKARGRQFHFGRLKVTDEPDGTVTEV